MSDSIIRLNVGGIHYDTTKSTLCRVSESMLERMFNGSIPSPKVKGRYFIDRNGQLFQYILDYLRDGAAWIPPTDSDVCRSLLREAHFYCLLDLARLLETILQSPESSTTRAFAICIGPDKVYCYANTPLNLKQWDKYRINGVISQIVDEIIHQAKQLGYSVTSCQRAIDTQGGPFSFITFEST
jgi:hypothetical protein